MANYSEFIDGIPVQFTTALSSEVAFSNLRWLTRWEKRKLEIICLADSDQVIIRCLAPFVRSNGTQFEGSFIERGGDTMLAGRFVASTSTRVASGLLLYVIALFLFAGLITGLHELFTGYHDMTERLQLLGGLTIWLAMCCLFAFVQIWNASPTPRDVETLTEAIQQSLLVEYS